MTDHVEESDAALERPEYEDTTAERLLQAIFINSTALMFAVDLEVINAASAKNALDGTNEAYVKILHDRYGDRFDDKIMARLKQLSEVR